MTQIEIRREGVEDTHNSTPTDNYRIAHGDNVMWSMYHDTHKDKYHDMNKGEGTDRDRDIYAQPE